MVRYKELHMDPEDGISSGTRNHPSWVFPEKIRFKQFKIKSVELPQTFFRSLPYFVSNTYNAGLAPGNVTQSWAHFSAIDGSNLLPVTSNLVPANFYSITEVIRYFQTVGGVSPLQTSQQTCALILFDQQQGSGCLTFIWSRPVPGVSDQSFMVKDPHAAEVLGFETGVPYVTTAVGDLNAAFPGNSLPATAGFHLTAPFPCQPHGMNYIYVRSNSMSLGCQYGIQNTPYGQAVSNTILAKIPLPTLNYVGERLCWTNHESEYLNFPGHQIDTLDLCFTSENLRDTVVDTRLYSNVGLFPQQKYLWKAGYMKYNEIDMRNGKWSVTFLLAECMCPDINAAYNVCNGI